MGIKSIMIINRKTEKQLKLIFHYREKPLQIDKQKNLLQNSMKHKIHIFTDDYYYWCWSKNLGQLISVFWRSSKKALYKGIILQLKGYYCNIAFYYWEKNSNGGWEVGGLEVWRKRIENCSTNTASTDNIFSNWDIHWKCKRKLYNNLCSISLSLIFLIFAFTHFTNQVCY